MSCTTIIDMLKYHRMMVYKQINFLARFKDKADGKKNWQV